MSSGHASHKGSSTKPNTNTNGQITSPADQPADPLNQETSGYPFHNEAMENPVATSRPGEESESGEEQQ